MTKTNVEKEAKKCEVKEHLKAGKLAVKNEKKVFVTIHMFGKFIEFFHFCTYVHTHTHSPIHPSVHKYRYLHSGYFDVVFKLQKKNTVLV